MANDFYNTSGTPAQGSAGSSATMRAEFTAIALAFDKFPALAASAGRLLAVNAGGTAIVSTNALAISGSDVTAGANFTVTGNLAVNGNTALGNAAGDTLTVAPSAVTWSNNPTHSGSHTFIAITVGALQTTGNTALGNDSADTLTVAGSAVTWSNNPTHSGNHVFSGNVTVTGNLAVNGNTTIGNASGDTLTVHPNAVTWQNNPTHSGNHIFSGNLTVSGAAAFNGGVTLGDAAGDALTINSSAVTWAGSPTHSNDHTFSGNLAIGGIGVVGGALLDTNAAWTVRGNATPNAADVTGGRGTLYLSGWGGATPGNGVIGTAIAFTGVATTRRKAMIAAYQDGGTQGVTGLSFWINGSGSITNEALSEAMRITSAGDVDMRLGSGSLKIAGLISRFESAEQAVPSATNVMTVAHGGSRIPDLFQVFLRCKTAELGYSVGDEVLIKDDQGDTSRAHQLQANATNVVWRYLPGSSVAPSLRNGSNVATVITPGSWRAVFKAHWL